MADTILDMVKKANVTPSLFNASGELLDWSVARLAGSYSYLDTRKQASSGYRCHEWR